MLNEDGKYCSILPVFSDPGRTCNNSYSCGVSNVADSQRALDNVTNTIANFK
ncbi:hypothetical protein [Thalassomonas actiniarum]|uniref:Uncharacterized protein n=1 Tax=Thalassomonas actiniarum TaxID=485447 RepID=A0AAE9YWQ2_9GAMM|nr:hypothetical protein [Thalassomonas actiniarum]WDE02586.1 hypothetical protein SG35_029725 [Thalassomonas actiniarum]